MATYGSDRINLSGRSVLTTNDTQQAKRKYSQCLETIHLAGLHLLISITIFGVGAVMEFKWTSESSCQTYFTLLYIRCAYWVGTYVLDAMITYRHNQLRRHGYHDFYRQNILIYKNAPFIIVTLWNMIMFFIQTLMQQNYASDFALHCQKTIRSPITYAVIFCGLETILLMFVHGTYIMKVWHFNRVTCLPDALRDVEQPFLGTLGITVDNAKVADLLEKQADLIYYLKEQNTHLNRKLMQLNERYKLNHWDRSGYNII